MYKSGTACPGDVYEVGAGTGLALIVAETEEGRSWVDLMLYERPVGINSCPVKVGDVTYYVNPCKPYSAGWAMFEKLVSVISQDELDKVLVTMGIVLNIPQQVEVSSKDDSEEVERLKDELALSRADCKALDDKFYKLVGQAEELRAELSKTKKELEAALSKPSTDIETALRIKHLEVDVEFYKTAYEKAIGGAKE